MSYLSGRTAGPLSGEPGGALSGYSSWPSHGPICDGVGQFYDQDPPNVPAEAAVAGAGQNPYPYLDPNSTKLAAAGDICCEGFPAGCHSGGTYGYPANYTVSGRNLRRQCAVKMLGYENEPESEKIEILELYPLFGRK